MECVMCHGQFKPETMVNRKWGITCTYCFRQGNEVVSEPMVDDTKRNCWDNQADFTMSVLKCEYCGMALDDRAVVDGEGCYTREVEFYCANDKCPGPPKMVKAELLYEAMALLQACEAPMLGTAHDQDFLLDYGLLKAKILEA